MKVYVSLVRAAATAAIFLAWTVCAQARDTANLTGQVLDPAGAAVQGAKVSARNADTGLVRETVSDEAGRYQIRQLPLGPYEIRASKTGFQETVRSGVVLVVGQDASVNLALKVGAVTETIHIVDPVALVSTETTDISGLVDDQQVKDLPLNGRSFDLLMPLNPGVVNFTSEKTGGPAGVSNSTNGNNFAVDGNRPQQNEYLLNGVEYTGAAENNMQPGGTSGQLLGVDAVREFNVLRDSYGAEYGKHPGAQVLIVTQQGTNNWHGSAYEFLRNNDLDSRNFFDIHGAPLFQRNQFGGALGGPIVKDKTFFFVNYEGFRQNLHQTSETFVPDAAARAGTIEPFGAMCPAAQVAACATKVEQLLNLWPIANGSVLLLGGVDSGISTAFYSPLQKIREDFGTARVDHVFSLSDSLSANYTVDDGHDNTATVFDPYSTDIANLRSQVLSVDETHIFSPTVVNVARFGYSRAAYFFLGEPTPGTIAAEVPGFVDGLPVGAVVEGGSTASNPATQLGLAGSNNGTNLNVFRNLFTYEDQVQWLHGKHTLTLGAWFQQFQSNEDLALSQFGQASFGSVKALLGGLIGTFTYDPAPTELNWRSLFAAWYAEDTIRLNRRVTLTLGFRGESSTGWNEAHGRAANYFFTGGVIDSAPHIGHSAFSTNNQAFLAEPRLGLAWSPFGDKTVVRAGFGIYNDLQDALGYRMDQNGPFDPALAISSLPVADLPAPAAFPVPAGYPPAPVAAAKPVPGGVQPNLQAPTLISYSLRVEREIFPNTAVTIGYVGGHGYHELLGLDANEPTPVICPAAPCPADYPAGFGALTGTPVPAGSYYIAAACGVGVAGCNPVIGPTWTWFSLGDSSYNALEIDVNHRFSHGLSLRGVYTWSRALDDGDTLNPTTANNAPGLVANPFDIRGDWGPATYNATNVAVINGVWELPFGRGQAFMNDVSGWSDRAISGWSIDSVVTLQSGFPITPQLSYNPTRSGDTKNPVRPFVNPAFAGPVVAPVVDSQTQFVQWFNPDAFIEPPNSTGFYGNLKRDAIPGPGLATWDFSVRKDTRITEGLNLQFRAEIFNLLDRANFNTPNVILATLNGTTPVPNPIAGQISSTSTTARQVQFALKLLW
jgi:hypothetical protein